MIQIKNTNGVTVLAFENFGQNDRYKVELMKEDSITLSFELLNPIFIGIGYYIETQYGKFVITELTNPKFNESTEGYKYEVRFDKYYYAWKNRIFKFSPEHGGREASWTLTASLDLHMDIFIKNLSSYGFTYKGSPYLYLIDNSVEVKHITISYDNCNMIDAMTQMAKSFECEWWVTGNTIHFGRCEHSGNNHQLEIGVNLTDMIPTANRNTYATRVYGFGSTRNLTSAYRPTINQAPVINALTERRLMIPASANNGHTYIDAKPNLLPDEVVEQIVIFDDVYPERTAVVGEVAVKPYTDKVTNEDGSESSETWNAYQFTDNDTSFRFSEKYILPGKTLRCQFTSGSLNGLSFDLEFIQNDEKQLYEIVRNDDYGIKIPNETLKPKAGDKFILYNFDISLINDAFIGIAEQRLLDKVNAYIERSRKDPNNYNCKADSIFVNDNNFSLSLGERVTLRNDAFFDDGVRNSRCIGWEIKLDIPYDEPMYIIGENVSYNRIQSIENKLDAVELDARLKNFYFGELNAIKSALSYKYGIYSVYPALKVVYDSLNRLDEWSKGENENERFKGFLESNDDFSFLGNAGIKIEKGKDGVNRVVLINESGVVTQGNFAMIFSQAEDENGNKWSSKIGTSVQYKYNPNTKRNEVTTEAYMRGDHLILDAETDIDFTAGRNISMSAQSIKFREGSGAWVSLSELMTYSGGTLGVANGVSGQLHTADGQQLTFVKGVLTQVTKV